MNELMNMSKGKNEFMKSIQLVEIINEYRKFEGNQTILRHIDFMLKIEKEFESDCEKFRSDYLASNNQKYRCYNLPKDECILMLMSESRIVRKGVLNRLNELENKTAKIPQTYSQALKLASEQAELIETMKPKAEFFDQVTGSKDAFDMADVAKVCNLGIGRNVLFQFLRENKILRRNNTPMQQYVDCGYFRVIETKFNKPDGSVNINLKTVVYQKGIDFIIKRFVGRNLKN